MNVHVARIVPGQIARNEARVLLDGQSRAYAAIDDLDARDDLKETLRFLAARVAANARMKLYHYRTAALADEGGFLLHFVASAFGPSLEIHVRGAEILFRSSPLGEDDPPPHPRCDKPAGARRAGRRRDRRLAGAEVRVEGRLTTSAKRPSVSLTPPAATSTVNGIPLPRSHP